MMETGTQSTGILIYLKNTLLSNCGCGTQETFPGFHEFGGLPH